jgi:hypothetical protein
MCLLVFGVICGFGLALLAVSSVSLHLKYGWISPNPDTPDLNELLLTPRNILSWQCGCWSCVASFVASWTWFRGRWRIAWAATFGWLVLYGAVMALQAWPAY